MIKSLALGILVLVSLTLGALLLQAQQQVAAQSARLATLETSVAKQHDELQASTRAAAALQQKQDQLAAKAKAVRQSLLAARAASTPAAVPADAAPTLAPGDAPGAKKGANPFSDYLAKMMKDPATKNMMRTAQAGAMRQMYGDLVKQWALSPEETNTFYDLLLDKQTDQMDRGLKLMDQGPGAVSKADLESSDDKIKASLGDDLYQQYKDYEKTIGGRLTANQLQQQLAGSNTALLTPDQSKVLIQVATEEPANLPADSYGSFSGNSANPMAMDPAQIDQFIKRQTDLNARIDARMVNVLSAEQLQAFKDQQQQTLVTQRAGMEMAAKMYGTPSSGP